MTLALGLLILAGGRSLRMGSDKPGLPFPGPDDPPLICRGAAFVSEVAGPPIIAGWQDYGTGWTVVPDEPELEGPAAGLIAGLVAATKDRVLVLGADLPFASSRLAWGLAAIAQSEPQARVVVPERAGRLEPLFAIYHRAAVADLRKMARQLSRPGQGPSLRLTVAGVRMRRVREAEWRVWDPDGLSFLNCNTPGELAAAAALAQAGPDLGGNP